MRLLTCLHHGLWSAPITGDLVSLNQNAARLLSTTGATIAGVGFGVVFAEALTAVGTAALVVGLAAHGVGMIASREAPAPAGQSRARWETIAYWLCWLLIAGLIGYLAGDAVGVW